MLVPVVGYEGFYDVNADGRVLGLKRKKYLSSAPNNTNGYIEVTLCKDGAQRTMKIHRIVAIAHVPNPLGKPQVNHIDGNKLNNAASNLEWVDNLENQAHAIATMGRAPVRKIRSEIEIEEILTRYLKGDLLRNLAVEYGFSLKSTSRMFRRLEDPLYEAYQSETLKRMGKK